MKTVIIIPARYKSTRFPGKPLAKILGKSMIQRVWIQCSKVMQETREFMGKTHEVYRDLPLLSLSFPFCLPITSSVYKQEDYVKNGVYNVVVNGYSHFAIQKRHDVFKHYNPFIMESPWKGPEALDGPIKDPGNNTLVNGPPKEKSS